LNYKTKTKQELIDEIKRLNRRLSRSESRMKKPSDKYDDLVLLLDSINWERDVRTADFISVSSQAEKHLGYPVKLWLDNPQFWESCIHEEDREKTLSALKGAIEGKKDTILEYRMLSADRLVLWIRDKITVRVKNGKLVKIYGLMTNVTAEKETERELIDIRENLELFFAQSLDGFYITMFDKSFIWDDNTDHEQMLDYVFYNKHKTRFNDAMLRIYGAAWNEFSNITLNELFASAVEEKRYQWKQLYDSGHLHFESKEHRLDGTEIWIEGDYICLYDDDGKINGHFGIQREISDRKDAEKQLKENKDRLELALKGTGAGLWDWNLETGDIILSKRAAEIIGYSLDDIQPVNMRTWIKLLHPDDRKTFHKKYDEHIAGKTDYFEHECQIKHKAGQWIWILNKGRISELDTNGIPARMTGTHLDITRRKIAEEKIKDSEEKYRSLLNSQNDAIFLHPFKSEGFGSFIEVNDIACERYGYSKEEFLNLNPKDITKHEDVEIHASVQHRNRLQTEGHLIFETEHISKTDRHFPVEISSKIIDIKDEKYILAVVRDISERKLLEGQLHQAQKMEAIGQLAGGVAHDFNNLLTIINGYCELLMQRDLNGDIRTLVNEIHSAGMKASGLTNQLLAFSRKQIIQPKIINFNDIITDQMKMLGRLLGENIQITTVLDPKLGDTKADPGQIEQVIMNIGINARDAMPFGGKLIIETSNKDFDEEYAKTHAGAVPGHFVSLAITDTGSGMDENTQTRIFEPFFTTKSRDKGTGLGLATVYGIIKQNQGFIYVYSELDRGTTFKIYMPLVEKTAEETFSSVDEMVYLQGTETILLVEDDEGVRKVTYNALNNYGYNVLASQNGKEAIETYRMRKGAIDLLLTDVIMPEMSGRQLADQLIKENPKLKILYFSGYTDNSIVHHGVLDKGMNFIQKPYTNVELAKKIRDILNSK